ncbi:helix-turn-helix domain-containing protein [Actinospica durhamensis]|uniref:Helix-turn-helix domain-containing protein n=1 Tax=Actinospica durhamensis TaxID=1508375 RepID=A0A941IQW6_9ACTN|nr:helix-turn-helix transcriptional regulator [Actinospica durhamensis]MBR7833338.1 helix-turn-helix domain-containing protein [Actinospica durhamensis]
MTGTGEEQDRRGELGRFLRAMRERLAPQDVGLPGRGVRRTPGLRRQEVAELACVSIDWYIRLEQGRAGTPGAAVLDGIARALRLSLAEREHLHLLARREYPLKRHEAAVELPRSLSLLLRGMPLIPAYVIDRRFHIVARNDAAAALFGEEFGTETWPNAASVLFDDPRVQAMQLDWERVARETVGNLRADLARFPDDSDLVALVADLRTHAAFRRWWDDHTVEERAHGVKRLAHPDAGRLTVYYDYLSAAEQGLRLVTLTPVDDSTADAIRSLIAHRTRRTAADGVRALAAA